MDGKLRLLSAVSQRRLLQLLEGISGYKDLFIDNKIIRTLDFVADINILRSQKVDHIYILQESMGLTPSTDSKLVFLVYCNLIAGKFVCDFVSNVVRNSNDDLKCFLILVPQKQYSLLKLLEEEGVYEYVTVYSFSWEFIEQQSSLFSLEIPNYFQALFIGGDQSLFFSIAKSIYSTFLLCGAPFVSIVFGKYSEIIYKMLTELKELPKSVDYGFDYFILLDRSVDYVSSLLIPAVYCGLLDEILIFNYSADVSKQEKEKEKEKEKVDWRCLVGRNEMLYNEVKDHRFVDVIPILKRKAADIQKEYDRSKKMQVAEMKQYVQEELRTVTSIKKSLSSHISGCEVIMNKMGSIYDKIRMMERKMLTGFGKRDIIDNLEANIETEMGDAAQMLRLISLLLHTQPSLTKEELSSLKTKFLHKYGYSYLSVFHRLESLKFADTCSILKSPSVGGNLLQIVPFLNVGARYYGTSPQAKSISEKDTFVESYVFDKLFTPVICYIIRLLLKQPANLENLRAAFPEAKVFRKKEPSQTRSIFVCFVGGVTLAEVAACRVLEKSTGCRIIVGTTNVVNGNVICSKEY